MPSRTVLPVASRRAANDSSVAIVSVPPLALIGHIGEFSILEDVFGGGDFFRLAKDAADYGRQSDGRLPFGSNRTAGEYGADVDR